MIFSRIGTQQAMHPPQPAGIPLGIGLAGVLSPLVVDLGCPVRPAMRRWAPVGRAWHRWPAAWCRGRYGLVVLTNRRSRASAPSRSISLMKNFDIGSSPHAAV